MDTASRERLVRVEEGVTHLTSILEQHVTADCVSQGCMLQVDVADLKNTQRNLRRSVWGFLTVVMLGAVTLFFKEMFNVEI